MGGHALNKVKTRRYKSDEYFALAMRMRIYLLDLFGSKLHFVQAYRAKETHGDMDILLYNDGSLGDIRGMINDYFKPGQIHCNGNVYSFDYEELQIDVILVASDQWETSKMYFSYDPLGNLMGKIAKQFIFEL